MKLGTERQLRVGGGRGAGCPAGAGRGGRGWTATAQVVCLGWGPQRPIHGSSWDRSGWCFFDQSAKKVQSWLKGNKREMLVDLNSVI